MKKQRYIVDVINIVLKYMETNMKKYDVYEYMEKDLQKLKVDCLYSAPELQKNQWYRLSWILKNYLGEPDTPEKQEISRIVAGV